MGSLDRPRRGEKRNVFFRCVAKVALSWAHGQRSEHDLGVSGGGVRSIRRLAQVRDRRVQADLSMFDRHGENSDSSWSKSPTSPESGRIRFNLAEFAPVLVEIAQHRPKSPEVVRNHPELRLTRPNIGRRRRNWPSSEIILAEGINVLAGQSVHRRVLAKR